MRTWTGLHKCAISESDENIEQYQDTLTNTRDKPTISPTPPATNSNSAAITMPAIKWVFSTDQFSSDDYRLSPCQEFRILEVFVLKSKQSWRVNGRSLTTPNIENKTTSVLIIVLTVLMIQR